MTYNRLVSILAYRLDGAVDHAFCEAAWQLPSCPVCPGSPTEQCARGWRGFRVEHTEGASGGGTRGPQRGRAWGTCPTDTARVFANGISIPTQKRQTKQCNHVGATCAGPARRARAASCMAYCRSARSTRRTDSTPPSCSRPHAMPQRCRAQCALRALPALAP